MGASPLYTPSRAPQGLNTASKRYDLFGDFPIPDPVSCSIYANDFYTYAAGDWTVTASSGTTALSAGVGGFITQTTAASTSDIQANQLATTSFYMRAGYRSWFWINVKLSDVATHNAFMAGFSNDFSTMAPTDGVYFSKLDASATVNLIIRASSTSTTVPVGTMVINTATTLGFYYNGEPTPKLHAFSSIGMTQNQFAGRGSESVYDGVTSVHAGSETGATYSLANLPSAALTLGFGIKTGANVAKTNIVDYVGGAQQISRF